jgi:hypothetical protein
VGQILVLSSRAGELPVSQEPKSPQAIEVVVVDAHLDVLDRPDASAYSTGKAARGDHLRVRPDQPVGTGWLAIEPLSTSILWIQESSLEFEDEPPDEPRQLDSGPIARDLSHLSRAWVKDESAVVRSGNLLARIPGPPKGELQGGRLVQLVGRPALRLGQGAEKPAWLAIVPPPEQSFYVHAEGVRWSAPEEAPPAAEIRASYDQPIAAPSPTNALSGTPTSSPPNWPLEVSQELERLDGVFRVTVASQPVAQWRFESVRSGYQSLLKRAGDRLDLEEAIRTRLARVTQHEQAARAARTIESILEASHRRDDEVTAARRQLTHLARARARAYDAVGFIQPSAHLVDGRKVFALIGREGKTIAYLDIPPGLDPEPFLASRVGVRGRAHFSEDLGTRLISVRDLESVERNR